MCPQCASDDVRITGWPFDFGVDPETGYHDAGESATFECLRCGCTGDVEGDLVMEQQAVMA